jgi:hypothetical protein
LTQPQPQALSTAFTHVVDSPKGDRPLQSHLVSLYQSACPTCGETGTAEWLAWDRELDRPFEKQVRCETCGGVQIAPPDEQDFALARSTKARGLAYYYALDRAASMDDPARGRTEELVDCYTPRNLSALMDLSRRVEGLNADEDVMARLVAALLDCFDRGSKLHPYGEDRPRPRTLRIPSRFLEHNVWLCFKESFSDLLRTESHASLDEEKDAAALVRGDASGFTLVASAARGIGSIVPPESATLVFVDPPRPDGVFWALSALWAAWIWDSPEAHAMRPFLGRRRFDWEWHWRALREALRAVGPRLTAQGFLVTSFDTTDDDLMASVCLAASSAGYSLRGWGSTQELGSRMLWQWGDIQHPYPVDVEALRQDITVTAEEAITSSIRRRGEPTRRSLLVAGAQAASAEQGALARGAGLKDDTPVLTMTRAAVTQGFDAAPIAKLPREETGEGEGRWWLTDPAVGVDALSDRVEATVRQLLTDAPASHEDALVNAVYADFPGGLSPDLKLVRACISSYGEYDGERILLRTEDDYDRRQREIDSMVEDLARLGRRLGFDVTLGGAWHAQWLESGEACYVFAISSTAEVAPYLLGERLPETAGRRCLVVPGSRAELISLKMKGDARLVEAVEKGGWQFIKFRYLRRLMDSQELDRFTFKTVLGLDPIAEQESAQIPLL